MNLLFVFGYRPIPKSFPIPVRATASRKIPLTLTDAESWRRYEKDLGKTQQSVNDLSKKISKNESKLKSFPQMNAVNRKIEELNQTLLHGLKLALHRNFTCVTV